MLIFKVSIASVDSSSDENFCKTVYSVLIYNFECQMF